MPFMIQMENIERNSRFDCINTEVTNSSLSEFKFIKPIELVDTHHNRVKWWAPWTIDLGKKLKQKPMPKSGCKQLE